MQALVPDGCRPTRLPSELVKRTAASVLQAHGVPEGGEYSTLQVRRGDTVDRCNTSVAAVREYMSCAERSTDGNSHGWEHAGDRLLLMTDETDATYLKALLAELRSDPRWAGGVTHLDAAILEALDSADRKDNYLVYAVAKWIEQNGGSSFEMRKCNGTATCGGMNFFMHAVRSQSRIMLSHAPPVSPQEMHDLRVIANSSVVIWHEKRNAGSASPRKSPSRRSSTTCATRCSACRWRASTPLSASTAPKTPAGPTVRRGAPSLATPRMTRRR